MDCLYIPSTLEGSQNRGHRLYNSCHGPVHALSFVWRVVGGNRRGCTVQTSHGAEKRKMWRKAADRLPHALFCATKKSMVPEIAPQHCWSRGGQIGTEKTATVVPAMRRGDAGPQLEKAVVVINMSCCS